MAKQTVNVGASPNDSSGDSIRAAFQKINANFTELYDTLGIGDDGAVVDNFEFSDSTISTTDSTAITIDQATTITSNLTVGGDIVPQTANGGDLGSSTYPWRSLYVSNNTIYIGGTTVGVDENSNLTVDGEAVNATGSAAWNAITGVGLALGNNSSKDSYGVALGAYTQAASYDVSIGAFTGKNHVTNDTRYTVAVGAFAQQNENPGDVTGLGAVAIGVLAGDSNQGTNAVALGRYAGRNNQAERSIVINATGSDLENTTADSFVVKPVREVTGGVAPAGFYPTYYNPTTGELIVVSP